MTSSLADNQWPHGYYRAATDLPESAGWGPRRRIIVTAGLHQVGYNPAPYFSVTSEIVNTRCKPDSPNYVQGGGSNHEDIARYFPELVPVIALHLADNEGVPMHAVANAVYWAGLGRYKDTSDGKPLPDFAILARHLRISQADAVALVRDAGGDVARFSAAVEAMRPRWAKEALDAARLIDQLREGREGQ